MGSVNEVVLRLVMDAEDKTAPGLGQMNANMEKVEKTVSVGKAAVLAFAGAAGGALVGALSDFARAAADEEVGIARLENSLAQTTDAGDRWNDAVDRMIERAQSLSFSDDEARAGLAVLAQETGSTEEALKRLPLAMDLARAKHIELEDAAKLLGKVNDENTKGLQRLGITVDKGATSVDVLAKVQRVAAGQSEGYANGLRGGLDRINNGLDNLKEMAGGALGPLQGLFAMMPGLHISTVALGSAVGFLASAEDRAKVAHAAHAVAIAAGNVVTKAFTIAQAALNLVLSANPIGIVVLALAGLAIGLKYAYDHSEAFRNIVQSLFTWIGQLLAPLQGLWDMVSGFGKSLGFLGPESEKMKTDVAGDFSGMKDLATGSMSTLQTNASSSMTATKDGLVGITGDMKQRVRTIFDEMADAGVGATEDMQIRSSLAAMGLRTSVVGEIENMASGLAGWSEQARDKAIFDMQYAKLETTLRAKGLADGVVAAILSMVEGERDALEKQKEHLADARLTHQEKIQAMAADHEALITKAGSSAAKIHELKDEIDRLRDKTITVTVNTINMGGPGPHLTAAAEGFEGMVGPGFGGPRLFLAGEGTQAEHVRIAPAGASGGRGGAGGDVHIGSIVIEGSVDSRERVEELADAIGQMFRRKGLAAGAPA